MADITKPLDHSQPKVSVIMTAYNTEKYLSDAIKSVLAQTYDNWELVIIDNGSSDRTGDIAATFARQDPRIIVRSLEENIGPALSRNESVRISQGKYLFLLDSDDIALPTRFETQVEFLEKHPEIGAVGSDADLIDENGKIVGHKSKPAGQAEIKFRMLLQTPFIHSSVCMRTEAFRKSGCFDAEFTYAEDYDLWSRMAANGCVFANIRQTLAQYRIHGQSISISGDTQSKQAELSFLINERNIAPYIALRHDVIILLVRLVNGYKLGMSETFRALYWYQRLLKAYCASPIVTADESVCATMMYRDRKRHVLRTMAKNMLRISATKNIQKNSAISLVNERNQRLK